MSDSQPKTSRRQFMHRIAAVAATLPIPVLLGWTRNVRAEDMPHVSEDDPMAKALKYTQDASTADARTDASALCSNCQHYSGAKGSEWGPCALFQGKTVSAKGWCTAWIKKSA